VKLRTVIKFTSALVPALFALGAWSSPIARADSKPPAEASYYTTRAVLAELFPASERVTYQTFTLAPAARARLTQRLGYVPARDRYTIFVATTRGKVDGYAVIDDEQGLHQPITFATRLSPRGTVERVEIMVYREPRGDEVRDVRFRRQFEGKTSQAPLRLGADIDAVSGATVSSASLATGVHRATILIEELALGLSTVASAPGAPDRSAPANSRLTVSR